jgi:hypothetical protein
MTRGISDLSFEIQDREFAVVFLSGLVVGFSGVNFVVKIADLPSFAVDEDLRTPFFNRQGG